MKVYGIIRKTLCLILAAGWVWIGAVAFGSKGPVPLSVTVGPTGLVWVRYKTLPTFSTEGMRVRVLRSIDNGPWKTISQGPWTEKDLPPPMQSKVRPFFTFLPKKNLSDMTMAMKGKPHLETVYALMDPSISMLRGWGYLDENPFPGRSVRYRFTIDAPKGPPSIIGESDTVPLSPTTVPSATQLSGVLRNHRVVLTWSAKQWLEYRLERKVGKKHEFETVVPRVRQFLPDKNGLVGRHVDSSVQEGQYITYRLSVRHLLGGGWIRAGELAVQIVETVIPKPVSKLQADGRADGIRLTWLPPEDKNRKAIRIYRNVSTDLKSGGLPMILAQVGPSTSEFVDKKVNPDFLYCYHVTTLSKSGQESPRLSPVFGRVMDTVPPAVPTDFSGRGMPGGIIRLSWTAPEDKDVSVYRLYRGIKGIRSEMPLPFVKAGSNESIHFDDPVDPLSPYPYVYSLTALDMAGNESKPTHSVEVAVPDMRPPDSPLLRGVFVNAKGLIVSWHAPMDSDVTGFHIYRQRAPYQEDPVRITPHLLPADQSSYTDLSVTGGVKYRYYVTATDKAGNVSAASDARSQRALIVPDL